MCLPMFEIWVLFICPTTRNPDHVDQPCIVDIPSRHKCYQKNRESRTDILHQQENYIRTYCIYLHFPAYYYPTSAKDLKRISTKSRPGQDSNQERPTRAMAPLTSKLWQVWHSVTISHLWSHHCEWSKKNSHYSFCVWFPRIAGKIPFESCTLLT